jgi:hypothetical protein
MWADLGDRIRAEMERLEDEVPQSTGEDRMAMWEVIARLLDLPVIEAEVLPSVMDEIDRSFVLMHQHYRGFVRPGDYVKMIAAVAFQQGVTYAVACQRVGEDAEAAT